MPDNPRPPANDDEPTPEHGEEIPGFGDLAAPGQIWHLRESEEFVPTADFTPARIRLTTVCRPADRAGWFRFADLDIHPWRPVPGRLDLEDLEICYALAAWPHHHDLATSTADPRSES
ncbi:hypothetical protein [Embleya hyalina]|uniref:Uncharacterized protein n=1 Tax=Embleya hyalina TaxID=516124 RepID=A0A401YYP8_9ACTN|nr:hypothetical protein [Embleya hyalina]GCD99749.1 hypothetical protein EHYA_07471 [Embleya hyalina]